MLLRIKDAPWNLIGKKKVEVNADGDIKAGDLLKLTNNGKAIAAYVEKAEPGDKNTISLDRSLRENLGADIGQNIQAEKLAGVPDAIKLGVRVGGGTKMAAERIKALLGGSIVCEGNKEDLLEGREDVRVVIGRTEPAGLVRVTCSTAIDVAEAPVATERILSTVQMADNTSFAVSTEVPGVRFSDVGGLEKVKRLLTENIIYAIQKDKAELYHRLGYKPYRGIMLYGPPGTGKTLIARAVAGESNASFIMVPGSKLKQEYYGGTEKVIRAVFDAAKKNAPCIVFIDEIDSVAYSRSESKVNIVNQLLVIMDEIRDMDVFVIGATNLIHMVDSALLRAGRLMPVEVPPPDPTAREQIFRINLMEIPLKDEEMRKLIIATEGMTGAQIFAICNNAKMEAMRETGFAGDTKLDFRHLLKEIGNLSNARRQIDFEKETI
jgi:transitional endoplasmic reticulum ATPase